MDASGMDWKNVQRYCLVPASTWKRVSTFTGMSSSQKTLYEFLGSYDARPRFHECTEDEEEKEVSQDSHENALKLYVRGIDWMNTKEDFSKWCKAKKYRFQAHRIHLFKEDRRGMYVIHVSK